MLKSHFKTLKSQLKKDNPFSERFPLLKVYSDKRLLRYEAMKEAPETYPLPHAVAKDESLMNLNDQ